MKSLSLFLLLSTVATHCLSQIAFAVGVGTSSREGITALAAAEQLGFNSVREDLPWALAEKPLGTFSVPDWTLRTVDFTEARKMSAMVILAYGHPERGIKKPKTAQERAAFAQYCVEMVRTLKGRVSLFEVWNEWDTTTGGSSPGSAQDYVDLLAVVTPAIKKANPDAIVLSGGISDFSMDDGWFDAFLRAGGTRHIDGLSLHPYTYLRRWPNNDVFKSIELVEEAISKADQYNPQRKLPVYVSELGWSTYEGKHGVSAEDLQINYLAYMTMAASNPRIAGVWWYGLRDQGLQATQKYENMGLLDFKLRPKVDADLVRRLNLSLRAGRPTLVCKQGNGLTFDLRTAGLDQPMRLVVNPHKLPKHCQALNAQTLAPKQLMALSPTPVVAIGLRP
jgi:polysaccharide biosynthesis protein PslG